MMILFIIIINFVFYRRNAGNLLRLISDDFNTRKFPELVAPFTQSLPATPGADSSLERGGGRWRLRAAANAFVFLRRLGQNTFGSSQHPLPDQEGEGDTPDQ